MGTRSQGVWIFSGLFFKVRPRKTWGHWRRQHMNMVDLVIMDVKDHELCGMESGSIFSKL